MSIEEQIREALKKVMDPEIGLNIVEAGFIRKIEVDENGVARIDMMLTSPFCPLSFYLQSMVIQEAKKVPGVKDVKVRIIGFGIPPELEEKLKKKA